MPKEFIRDIYQQDLNAVTNFNYMGYEVSISTLAKAGRIEVSVFNEHCNVGANFPTVESAIQYVNKRVTVVA